MGLAILILGLIVFVAPHVFVTRREARAAAVARLGEWPYKGLFSLVSIIGVILIGWGFARYRASGYIPVWSPPDWTRHVAVALMWPAIVFFVAAYIPGNIKRALKHPMLVGVKLWAFAHLIANGDLGSIILFGGILAWAVFDRISLNHRSDPGGPPIAIGGVGDDVIALIAGTRGDFFVGYYIHPHVLGAAVFSLSG